MFNLALIVYFVLMVAFLLCSAAIVYHLVKYQLNRKSTWITTGLFLAGALFFFLMNVSAALQVDWSQFTLSF